METRLFEVVFKDGRKFNVFCNGKAQIKRFFTFIERHENKVKNHKVICSGIHSIVDFEKINKK